MEIAFWGVRGDIPVPEASLGVYGGNTLCFSANVNEKEAVIFEAGTGLLDCFATLAPEHLLPECTDIFISSYRPEHIQSIPFLSSMYISKNKVRFCGPSTEAGGVNRSLGILVRKCFCPVPNFFDEEDVGAEIDFLEMADDSIKSGSLTVSSYPLAHQDGTVSLCWRIDDNSLGKCIAYIPDIYDWNYFKEARANLPAKFFGADVLLLGACSEHTSRAVLQEQAEFFKSGRLVFWQFGAEAGDNVIKSCECDKIMAAREGMIVNLC